MAPTATTSTSSAAAADAVINKPQLAAQQTSKPRPSTASFEGRPQKIHRPTWHAKGLFPDKTWPLFEEANANKQQSGKRTLVCPPDVSEPELRQALADLEVQIGAENVEMNDGPLIDSDYHYAPLSHDGYHILDQDDLQPSSVCYPGSTDEVVLVVKWANKWNIPLWPISMGRNLGYGGSAPRLRGSIVVDLGKRMNKVLDVSEEDATVLLEPGVQYMGLYEHLNELGLGTKLWIDVPDLPGGSVMGNALDRGLGYTQHGDHWGSHCGMEVVLPNGDVVRTGMGAMPGSETWQLYPYGFGPHHDGIFSQSNFGICTKIGMQLMPNPGGIRVLKATFENDVDLIEVVEILRPLIQRHIIGNAPVLRPGLTDAITHRVKADFGNDERGIITREEEKKFFKDYTSGAWNLYMAFYGPDPVTLGQMEHVKAQFSQVQGVRFYGLEDVGEHAYLHSWAAITAGIPSWQELNMMNWVPGGAHLFFAPISATRGKKAFEQRDICRDLMEEFGFNYIGAFFIGPREMHHVSVFMYDKQDPEEKARALACMRRLVDACADLGAGEYRTHLALADQVAASYNWNDGALSRLNQTLKDALDPNGIMAPGRSGIWPQKYLNRGFELLGGEVNSHKHVQPKQTNGEEEVRSK